MAALEKGKVITADDGDCAWTVLNVPSVVLLVAVAAESAVVGSF